MATYSNQHWLLSHIRNSFVSTDDSGICETVMQSDDLPKHFLRKFQTEPLNSHRKSNGGQKPQFVDRPLQEEDFVCYPGLDQSDDEDIDLSSQSFDIQMYPEVGYRYRSNTAQKLEKMDIARRKAARTKCINFDDEIIPPEDNDFFVKKPVSSPKIETKTEHAESELSKAVKNDDDQANNDVLKDTGVKSKLSLQLANSPKQSQNKFMEYARFDGTSQTGMQTKRINVFLNMLPERERNYPIKICVVASAKILEVIGFVCYKATIQFPDIPLKSIRHYALYMTEDNDDLEDFPPLDNREPCSKFGFSHLTLAERRPLVPVTRIDYNNTLTKSTNSEEEKARLTADAVRSLQSIQLNGGKSDEDIHEFSMPTTEEHLNIDYDTSLGQLDMLEAPLYRTYRLYIIDKRVFKTEVTLGISGERIEIDQQKHAKFWSKQKAVTYPIESVAHCEIIERRNTKATIRIYLKSSSSSSHSQSLNETKYSTSGGYAMAPHSPTSPSGGGHSSQMSTSPFSFLHSNHHHPHMRFKHYDFEAPIDIAEHIENKLKRILEVRTSDARREFLNARERKLEKQGKKHSKT